MPNARLLQCVSFVWPSLKVTLVDIENFAQKAKGGIKFKGIDPLQKIHKI